MLERLRDPEDSLQDHELLEILLYACLPRVNTNRTAHELLDAFGSLQGVFAASYEQLLAVPGIGRAAAGHLKSLSLIFERLRSCAPKEKPYVFTYEKLFRFVEERFAGRETEVGELYALDSGFRVVGKRSFTSHDTGTVLVMTDEIMKFFTEFHPQAVIIAHNHPYCNSTPSSADDDFTAKMHCLCSLNNATLYDHVIYSAHGIFSYRMENRLEKILDPANIERLLSRQERT